MKCEKLALIAFINYIAYRVRNEARSVNDVLKILEEIESRIRELSVSDIEKELFL